MIRRKTSFGVVLVTVPDLRTARRLANAALKARLAACANIILGLESHYWWQGKIAEGAEVLMLLKAPYHRLAALERLILSEHPYDTPEFIVLRVARGNRKYLDWLEQSASG